MKRAATRAAAESGPFGFLYEGNDARDAAIFKEVAKFYRPPAQFNHGEWHLVVDLPKSPKDGDGHPVRIYESRVPARFFKIEVLDSHDGLGRPKKGFTLSTGSGDEVGGLVVKLALSAAQGMIGLREEESPR